MTNFRERGNQEANFQATFTPEFTSDNSEDMNSVIFFCDLLVGELWKSFHIA